MIYETDLFIIFNQLSIHHYQVVGRLHPTNGEETPIYRMRLFAPNPVTAKSRYWYFLANLHKLKRASGEILAIRERNTQVKTYGIWLRYNSRSGTHNMYKEFRDTTLLGAVKNLYADMAGRHRARDRSIQIIRTAIIPAGESRRAHNHLYEHQNPKFALPHRIFRAGNKKYRTTFLADRPTTFFG
ncbi:hypothetical protein WA158_006537 [Blastocystis sp. Blastoise]